MYSYFDYKCKTTRFVTSPDVEKEIDVDAI